MLRIVPHTVPRVGRSYEHLPDGFELHLLTAGLHEERVHHHHRGRRLGGTLPTKGPMWGYPRPVLGAVDPFLEPFRGRLSPNIDNVSEKLTLRYPLEGPWVDSKPCRANVERLGPF